MTDTYTEVTEQILSALRAGTIPWRQPWRASTDMPRNIDGRSYRGVNVFTLLMTARARGYSSPRWATFNAVKSHGGMVLKGERASHVYFWKMLQSVRTDEETGEKTGRLVPFLRSYSVFNTDQTSLTIPAPVAPINELEPIEAAQFVVNNYPAHPSISIGESMAWYRPSADLVGIPRLSEFDTAEHYYSTLFHELGHSTGHRSRLNRDAITSQTASFGSMNYGREELVAEMTAAFLCGETGIAPATVNDSAAYLASWIKTIKEDERAVIVAAGNAQKAADLILNRAHAMEVAA